MTDCATICQPADIMLVLVKIAQAINLAIVSCLGLCHHFIHLCSFAICIITNMFLGTKLSNIPEKLPADGLLEQFYPKTWL